jgi:hypothetical protein
MYTLLVLTALAQQPVPPADNGPSGMPPEQVMASIDAKGKLTIVHVACNCYGPAAQETTLDVPAKNGEKAAKVKVKVSSVMVTTAELPAKHVEAYTADGTRVEPEKLAKLLAKEKMVLLAMDNKKVDPALLQLYKDDTIVLVPPTNVLSIGTSSAMMMPGPGTSAPIAEPTAPVPPPERKVPEKDEKE